MKFYAIFLFSDELLKIYNYINRKFDNKGVIIHVHKYFF